MKVTTIKRYSCDFCKKKSLAAWSMRNHEEHCTLNPSRTCKMCDVADRVPPTPQGLARLVAIVPKTITVHDEFGESIDRTKSLDALRSVWDEIVDAVESCPACIMAVLRQGGFPLPMVYWWSFTDACKQFWDEVNADKIQEHEV